MWRGQRCIFMFGGFFLENVGQKYWFVIDGEEEVDGLVPFVVKAVP